MKISLIDQISLRRTRLGFLFILISSVSEPFWEEYSDENIKNGETQRLNAVQLRNIIDGILKKLVADIKQAIEKTRRSFDRRIYESKQAKQQLEDQLRDVNF
jgi:hypothetical protein